MLEQWRADQLLRVAKVYSLSSPINLAQGADDDYPVESDDGSEHFLLDIWRPKRNVRKARFQLRYRRDIVLARLCTSVPHTNPDGLQLGFPHMHRYRESDGDKWAEKVDGTTDLTSALDYFCKAVNLPAPDLQGGLA
ncbi:hypothetical protein [Amycolatopsis sp. ATCC 39116]|uniref:DUF6978 family protein n=1 Tax=Amycolatopsis sp. (strain ATCC 39116 / 75iv2) TaxID=385957 RepID=UPI0012FB2D90|nr:hypothetical protein [Amycolatopsis sp. ATCC 39116]